MRTLVTGGAGFVGSNLVDALVARGDDVTVLDDLSTGRREYIEDALAQGAELVTGDVRDGELLAELLGERQPETVFHLAAQIDVRRSVADPAFDASVNAGGTASLLEAARVAEVGRFVLMSTGGAIYGEGDGKPLPLDEGAPVEPLSPYGQSKYAAEGYVSLYGRLHGLSGVSLRPGNIYGPRQDPLGEGGVVAIFCGRLNDGARPTVFGDGRQTRDYVYVGDVVEAALLAAGSDARGAYNIGTGIETNVLELAERLGGLRPDVAFEPEFAPERTGEVRRIALDAGLARRELGWSAETTLERGLELTLASL